MPKQTANEQNLIRRYLIWCYKTTKEELDRIDRKFTQIIVDEFMLKALLKGQSRVKGTDRTLYGRQIEAFKEYMLQKESGSGELKFSVPGKKELKAEYAYLANRLLAVEKAVAYFLGKKEVTVIRSLYEEEMTKRILESREHK